jgi:hypothetical protein
LQQGHSDLVNSIYCACNLNRFSRVMGQGAISLIQQIHIVLPHPCDHRLEAYLIIEQLNSWVFHSISNADTLISDGLGHFKKFHDPDLKCMLLTLVCWHSYEFMQVDSILAWQPIIGEMVIHPLLQNLVELLYL